MKPPVNSCNANYINIMFFLLNIRIASSIWPPSYSVNLNHEETFVISELLEQSDVQDVYDEEEMIKKEDLAERLNVKAQNEKYFRIHQQARRYNDKLPDIRGYNENKTKMYKEFNPDMEDEVPWKGGFVDEQGNFKQDEGIIYFDGEPYNHYRNNKPKRSDEEVESKTDDSNYDYNDLKAKYDKEIKEAENANDTLKYSTVKEDESVKDSVKAMVDFNKTPKNCTAEEMTGIGFNAMKCIWMEIERPRMKSHIFEKVIRITIIWIVLYVVVAIPCWCQYGWCCCCCRCKFCKPRKNIAEVQKFYGDNPIGVYHDEKGNVYTYKPTSYEKYAYKKLEQELNRL